jgi:hypothetical protein
LTMGFHIHKPAAKKCANICCDDKACKILCCSMCIRNEFKCPCQWYWKVQQYFNLEGQK